MDVNDYVRDHAITVEIVADHGERDTEGWRHHAYRLRLHYGDTGRTIDTDWKQGLGIHTWPDESPGEVFDSLLSDATIDADSFEDFASEFGYDTDSRRAFAIWEACVALREPFEAFVGGPDEMALVRGLDRL